MTKLFGAVVGFLSFFQTRPTDKAKVGRKSIAPSQLMTPFFAEHRSTTAYLDSTTTSQLDSFSWPQACSGTKAFNFCLALIDSCAFVSLNDLFGKAILCRGLEGSKVTEAPDAVTQYCWVSGTYTGQNQQLILIPIADSAQTEYCTTFHCSCVRPCVRPSQA